MCSDVKGKMGQTPRDSGEMKVGLEKARPMALPQGVVGGSGLPGLRVSHVSDHDTVFEGLPSYYRNAAGWAQR
jgi:hypothetical protein